jgi:hypothetical protein
MSTCGGVAGTGNGTPSVNNRSPTADPLRDHGTRGDALDVALHCAYCGSPSSGDRFCTACGAALPASPFVPAPRAAHEQGTGQLAASPSAPTAVLAPWAAAAAAAGPDRPRRRLDVLVLLAVVALLLSGWWMLWGVEQHTLHGTVVVVDRTQSRMVLGADCAGRDDEADIREGAFVVLVDDRGEKLASGRLSGGEFDGAGCVFSFALEDLPRAGGYALTVGGAFRDSMPHSYDDLRTDGWSVEISLGDVD